MNDFEQPFVGRGKSMLDQLLSMAQTRLEMLSTEIQQEKLALTMQLRLAVVAGVCALLAGLTLIVWIALAFPPETRLIILGALFGVLVLISVICMLVLRRRAQRPPFLARVIHQLRLDRASLGPES
jgi:uncharacterized membrane protein YqjE